MGSDIQLMHDRLQITRVFQAPRPLVFSYWSHADRLQQWSGCKDATDCHVEMDFRVGGSFVQTMRIKGSDFTVKGTYTEIVEPEKISYQIDLGPGGVGHVVVEFMDQGGSTKVVLTQEGLPDETMCKIVSQGTSESFDNLHHMLAAQPV